MEALFELFIINLAILNDRITILSSFLLVARNNIVDSKYSSKKSVSSIIIINGSFPVVVFLSPKIFSSPSRTKMIFNSSNDYSSIAMLESICFPIYLFDSL